MLAVISPAKDLDMEPMKAPKGVTMPGFLDRSEVLIKKLRGLSAKQLAKLMDISPKLAELNRARYAAWELPFTKSNAKPAAFAFNGEAYRGLDISSLGADDLRYAQDHLRILSGLYGTLRPLDLMQAYRLEMGTSLSVGRGAKNLYAYWGDTITDALNHALVASGSDVLINLASTEYFKSVRPAKLEGRIITPVFKDRTATGLKMVMVFAKHQRGAMCRWIVEHRLMEPEKLKRYDVDGYRYAKELSTVDEWVFTRER